MVDEEVDLEVEGIKEDGVAVVSVAMVDDSEVIATTEVNASKRPLLVQLLAVTTCFLRRSNCR